MPPTPVTINVSPEVMALATAASTLFADIKAKKPILQSAEEALAPLIGAIGQLENIGTDIQAPDNIAYLVKQLSSALLPPVTQS